MRILVLDTDILVDNVHGFARWLDRLLTERKNFILIVPTIVIAEYLTAREHEKEENYLKSKRYLGNFKFQDLTPEIAEILGKMLRRRTYSPGASMTDLIVASTAIFLNAELATRNRKDFQKIPHLRFFEEKSLSLN